MGRDGLGQGLGWALAGSNGTNLGCSALDDHKFSMHDQAPIAS
jgi:hypothetical protein